MFYNAISSSNASEANMATAAGKPTLHVFGGTSDARHICQRLDEMGLSYSLSVATDAGRELAGNINGEIIVGRMDAAQMSEWLQARRVTQVIDASHPYAGVLSANIAHACATQNIALLRYLRPSEIDALEHPLLHKVASVEEACVVAHRLGERVLLTTGSKQLADFVRLLAGKTLFARVLPTPDVLLQCQDLGLGVDNVLALKGPFSAEMNQATYQHCQADVVITKESGAEGGYQQKVVPCLALNIPCIVICRPSEPVTEGLIRVSSLAELEPYLADWLQNKKSQYL